MPRTPQKLKYPSDPLPRKNSWFTHVYTYLQIVVQLRRKLYCIKINFYLDGPIPSWIEFLTIEYT